MILRKFIVHNSSADHMSCSTQKRIGAFHRMQFDEGLEAIAIGCMTRASADERAWSMDEVQVLVADARRDLKNPEFHGHNNL